MEKMERRRDRMPKWVKNRIRDAETGVKRQLG